MFITSLIQCRICIFHSKVKNLRGHEHITQPKSSNFTHEESQLFGNGGHPFIPFPPGVAVCDVVAEFEEPTHIHGLFNKDFFTSNLVLFHVLQIQCILGIYLPINLL